MAWGLLPALGVRKPLVSFFVREMCLPCQRLYGFRPLSD